MNYGKSVSHVVVDTFALAKQRPVDNLEPVPLFVSIVYGEDSRLLVDQAQSFGDRAPRVDYVCPGREQDHGDRGTGGVYEMDQETYQMRKVD